MKTFSLDEFYRGWFIGDFEPSIIKTKLFEVGLLSHRKGEKWPAHFHEFLTEYNLLIKGKMIINGTSICKNQIFIFKPGEVADPVFLEDCEILCIKIPSIPQDKIIIQTGE